jgi:hypothetical protein
MIDSWSNEGLMIYGVTQEAPITLTPGTSIYPIGSSGVLTTRPMSILSASVQDSSGREYPLRVLSPEEYAAIHNKALQSRPHSIFDPGGYPNRALVLYPVPAAAGYLNLFTKRPLELLDSLDSTVSFPPGYEEALIYNGAVRLAPEYGRTVSQEVALVAVESKASLKRSNYRPGLLKIKDVPAGSCGVYNIVTGEYE